MIHYSAALLPRRNEQHRIYCILQQRNLNLPYLILTTWEEKWFEKDVKNAIHLFSPISKGL